jgi:hypothetical protein
VVGLRRAAGVVAAIGVAAAGVLTARAYLRPEGVSYRQQLASGARFANALEQSLRALPPESIGTPDALALLYLERHRAGLGSPFRLIDQAIRDPAIESATRRRLAYGLFARTLAGNGYRTEATALDLMSPVGVPETGSRRHVGAIHSNLIDATIAASRDPRTGEFAVRLAYQLAAASGAVSSRAPELASGAAAQARDRILAMRDARLLLEAAEQADVDLFSLMRDWREHRRFRVERPLIDPLASRAERAATDEVPSLLARLETLAESLPPSDEADSSHARRRALALGDGAARRIAGVAQARRGPPQPPVRVVVLGYGPLVRRGAVGSGERASRARFVEEARNEETLAAEYALLSSRAPAGVPEAAATLLTAAVALRPYAQERAWLPNDMAPSARELQLRYGVAVTYDPEIPGDWRAYLRRGLGLALDDLTRVFPGFDTRGLQVRFGESPLRERALALHDPVSRMVYLPPASGAGVMAHEFAHDLDWQAARQYYGTSVGYRTDRAVRQSTDRLAGALRLMASAARSMPEQRDPASRPTEVFARNVDWFVSAALARHGRVNGYLSSVQDPMLTGYGSAISPEATREGGSATLRALDGMTTMAPALRSWYEETFGANRRVSSSEAVRRVLETPLSPVALRHPSLQSMSAFEATSALFRAVPEGSAARSCLLGSFAERAVDGRATRSMMILAAEARARGVVRRWKAFSRHYSAWASLPFHILDAAPYDPGLTEGIVRDVRDAILWRALGAGAPTAPFLSGTSTALARCGS